MSVNIQNHYHNIANIYDELWFYSEDFVQFLTKSIIKHLRLNVTDTLLDLGCGTGIYSQEINNQLQLDNAIICVDFSDKMLEQIPNNSRYECTAMDAMEFVALPRTYNKILIKELIHHIDNKEFLFSSLFKNMPVGGVLLLILLPPTINYPLFNKALRKYEEGQPHYNELTNILEKIGFNVGVDFIEYPLAIPKPKYLQMVQNRYMSLLSSFNDEELALGLAEMEQQYAQESVLKFTDCFVFITASKACA